VERGRGRGYPYRPLGNTGEKVSVIGLGGSHIGRPTEEESIRIVRTAIDSGVNFLDNCWDYYHGMCEVRMEKPCAMATATASFS